MTIISERRISFVSKKFNEKFIKAYEEVDKVCCEKFGAQTAGVEVYINKLNNARFAPGRDEVLQRLANYKNLKSNFENTPALVRKSSDVVADDIKWLNGFAKALTKKKDPISVYLRKARNFARRRKIRNVVITLIVIAAIAAAAYFGLGAVGVI